MNNDLKIIKSTKNTDLGVLSNGEPYLNSRALAKTCGVDPANITRLAKSWIAALDEDLQPKTGNRLDVIWSRMSNPKLPPFAVITEGNVDVVCWSIDAVVSIIQYYAYEGKEEAQQFTTSMLAHGLVNHIYDKVGYQPEPKVDLFADWGIVPPEEDDYL